MVTCGSGEGANTVLSGFVITGGNFSSGGGMRNQSSSPTVTDCTFTGNTASLRGGGMYNVTASSPTVTDCTFCDNSPDHIGGQVVLSGQVHMSTFCPVPVCPGDITGDGVVGINDFLDLLAAWGPCK